MALVNEHIVLESYLEHIKNDDIEFLKGKDSFKNSISKEINLLIEEQDMNIKIQIAKNLWKLLFEAAMSYIDPDKRGYDNIFSYFDEYVNFEELIFASDSFYRDHTMHCLWVYFLGEYLKKNDDYKSILPDVLKPMIDQISALANPIKNSKLNNLLKDALTLLDSFIKVGSNSEAIRCISSLTHDLGYPLKKIGKVNKCIKKILPYFSINNYDEFNFKYSDIQQNFINDFLDFLSNNIVGGVMLDAPDGSEIDLIFRKLLNYNDGKISVNDDEVDKLSKDEYTKIENFIKDGTSFKLQKNLKKHLSYSNDFEQYEHGIMSAFLLMKTIHAFNTFELCYTDDSNLKYEEIDFAKVNSLQTILTAISDHTCFKYQFTNIYETSAFLIFIDELEEFSRISRANQSRQYVAEFCKTDLSFVDGWFQVDFIFDNENLENLDPEFAFKGRCRRFLTLFDICNMDDNLKIRLRCIDKVFGHNNIYCLEIAKKHADIIINGEEQNIPDYLRSKIFYTKEEYSNL